MVTNDSTQAIDHGSNRAGRWLEERRIRLALWIAAVEALIVVVSQDITKWTVIVIAIISAIAYVAVRDSGSHLIRQIVWILAASSMLAVIAAILAWIVKWAVVTVIVIFAVLGLVYLFLDHR